MRWWRPKGAHIKTATKKPKCGWWAIAECAGFSTQKCTRRDNATAASSANLRERMLLIATKSISVYPIGRVAVLPWVELLIHPYALQGTPPQTSPLSTVERTILIAKRKPPVVDKSWFAFLSKSKVCLRQFKIASSLLRLATFR